ncbi:sulfatase [Lentisphaera marina]|uniref:sulfatase n=1 Tax=Lentisphaera marina TaxID=1111041 RepID=UPI002366828A|nr:sulfatase [Lentisphaera marina]MDD7986562.1 sulfatase [Lentisphaera marina]
MKKLLLSTLVFFSALVYAEDFDLKGQVKKLDSKPGAFQSKNFTISVKDNTFIKGSDALLSFDYFDDKKTTITITYSTSEKLYEMLSDPLKRRTVDIISCRGTQTWKTYYVRLDKVNFDKEFAKHHINISSKDGMAKIHNLSLQNAPAKKVIKAQKDRLNVLMIVSDDLNDYIKAYGDPQAVTPNVDKLLSMGTQFNKAYCQYPVCGPSRASFLSGLYPESSLVIDNTQYLRDVNPQADNMLEHFRNNGYWTGAAGKIFHSKFGMMEKGISLDEYEAFENAENPQRLLLKKRWESEGKPGDFKAYYNKNKVRDQADLVLGYGTELSDDQHGDGRNARRVAQWIKTNAAGDKPFFMACGIVKPHTPFYAPKKYLDLYPKDKLIFDDVPEDDWSNRPKIAGVKRYEAFRGKLGVNDRENRKYYLQSYLGCISFMDAQVKVLVDALKESGQMDNTVIVFMSDHGFQIGEHFMYGKVTLFEECARVPFGIVYPGNPGAGKQTDSLAELIDVYPTLVDLCQLPQPSHELQGKSLVPVTKDTSHQVRSEAYTVVQRGKLMGRAIRKDSWVYAHWGSDKDVELYNMDKDPNQYNNLAKNPEHSKILKKTEQVLKQKASEQTLNQKQLIGLK